MSNSLFKKSAEDRLEQFRGIAERLLRVYTGILAGLCLLSALAPTVFSAMNTGGGLGAIGVQTVLTTVTVGLRLLPVVLLPFMTAGLRFAMLKLSRGEIASQGDLWEGFRRLGTVLLSTVFQLAQYALVGYVATALGEQIFLYTPMGQAAISGMFGGEYLLSMKETVVLYVLIGAAFVLLATPVFYRYRFVDYVMMDGAPALPSLLLSRAMTRRRRLQLFRLDLSFWWVWLGLGLTVAALYAPVLVELPYPWLNWLLPVLAAGGQLLIGVYALPRVALTYAGCYDSFRQAPAPEPERSPVGEEKLPWDGWQ